MNNNFNDSPLSITTSVILGAALIVGAFIFRSSSNEAPRTPGASAATNRTHPASPEPFTLPFAWNDLGQKLVSVGVIDENKFLSLYAGAEREEARRLISERQEKPLVVRPENASIVQNILWAAGLGNKSAILDRGEMTDPRFGGRSVFASTAGWTISSGNSLDHYSRHPFAKLTTAQEALVDEVSRHIFRPCCDNSTHFPDCNHGMAMLGALELMAKTGASEATLYETALALNRLWFPTQYEKIDRYVAARMEGADAKTVLSRSISSGSGLAMISKEFEARPSQKETGGGCSV